MSKGKSKLPKRLFKGTDRISHYANDRSPTTVFKLAARGHDALLENIEKVLIFASEDVPEVDDRIVALSLQAILNNTRPQEKLAVPIFHALAEIRREHNITESEWFTAIQFIYDSVMFRSACLPGSKTYLGFARSQMT